MLHVSKLANRFPQSGLKSLRSLNKTARISPTTQIALLTIGLGVSASAWYQSKESFNIVALAHADANNNAPNAIQNDISPLSKAVLIPGAVSRSLRDVYTVAIIASDYLSALQSAEYESLKTPEEKEKFLEKIHRRSAIRLRELFCQNAGIYIKIGQHMTQLAYLLPMPYVEEMMPMLDKAPTRSMEDVQAVVEQDFGQKIEDLFEEFELKPIASASLAQVHVAKRKGDNRKLAVKVQHRDLRETSQMDIWMIDLLINAVYWKFPSVDYRWLVDEVKINLPRELNFTLEGQNAEKCHNELKNVAGVHVPKIHWDLSSRRVLTMDFEEGIPLSDVPRLKKEGIDPSKVAFLISSAFCSQIFMAGFVHCDPHPGNILVRKKKGDVEIVLLDHGLYRVLSPEFRLNYAHLWKAIYLGNEIEIAKYGGKMNCGDLYRMLASVLTLRPWNKIVEADPDNLVVNSADPSSAKQLSEYAQQYVREISQVLARVPREVLLLLKTNDCLRSIDRSLNAPVNTFVLTGRYSIKAVQNERLKKHPGIRTWFYNIFETLNLEVRLFAFKLLKALQPFTSISGRSVKAAA